MEWVSISANNAIKIGMVFIPARYGMVSWYHGIAPVGSQTGSTEIFTNKTEITN